MTTTLAPPRMTVDEYFALEMATEYPNEYRAGEIIPIDRTELRVSLIKVPLLIGLDLRSDNGGFEALLSFRVRIPEVSGARRRTARWPRSVNTSSSHPIVLTWRCIAAARTKDGCSRRRGRAWKGASPWLPSAGL